MKKNIAEALNDKGEVLEKGAMIMKKDKFISLLFKMSLLALIVIQISCKHDVASMLSGGNYKYWYIKKGNTTLFYYFDNEGHWTQFKSSPKRAFYKWVDPCWITQDVWEQLENDTINIGGYPMYFFDSIQKDHFVIRYKVNDGAGNTVWERDTFYAAPEGMIPLEFQRKLKVRKHKTIIHSHPLKVEYGIYLE